MKYVAAAVVALVLYAIFVHYLAKFCGFNQLGHDDYEGL